MPLTDLAARLHHLALAPVALTMSDVGFFKRLLAGKPTAKRGRVVDLKAPPTRAEAILRATLDTGEHVYIPRDFVAQLPKDVWEHELLFLETGSLGKVTWLAPVHEVTNAVIVRKLTEEQARERGWSPPPYLLTEEMRFVSADRVRIIRPPADEDGDILWQIAGLSDELVQGAPALSAAREAAAQWLTSGEDTEDDWEPFEIPASDWDAMHRLAFSMLGPGA